MSGWLVDTNVLSEMRKGTRADRGVQAWYAAQPADGLFLSVATIGEVRRGVLLVERRDPAQASFLTQWLGLLLEASAGRVLDIDRRVMEEWAVLMVPDPRPVIDALLAATALAHDLVVVTRNVADFAPMGVRVLDPFTG